MNQLDQLFTPEVEVFSTAYFTYLKQVLDRIDLTDIKQFVNALLDARERYATVYFMGNGGSAATASHFANDLSYGTLATDKPFRAVSLTDNDAVLTALGNDFGFDEIFVRQLKIQARPGDMVVGISASGNSPNLVKALEYAAQSNLHSVAITAFDGGKMKNIADQGIHIPTEKGEYGPAEDAHLILDHLVIAYLMRFFTYKSNIRPKPAKLEPKHLPELIV